MFRQFGARMIENGRQVLDDYWEAKAREAGFTAGDAASEMRTSAAKASEPMAAQASPKRPKSRFKKLWKAFKL